MTVESTTMRFDKVPTKAEKLSVDDIAQGCIDQAWQPYESKPEYKQFNKHDLIETMLPKKPPNAAAQ